MNFPRPRNVKQLISFLGSSGYYREYVENFFIRCACLNNLLHKAVRWKWTENCQQSLDDIIKVLTSEPSLVFFDNDCKTLVYMDACKEGLGALLKEQVQTCDDPMTYEECVVAYWGRRLKKHEQNYATVEKECLAAVNAIKHWHVFFCSVSPLQWYRITKLSSNYGE